MGNLEGTSFVLFHVISWIAFFGSVHVIHKITRTLSSEQDTVGNTSVDKVSEGGGISAETPVIG